MTAVVSLASDRDGVNPRLLRLNGAGARTTSQGDQRTDARDKSAGWCPAESRSTCPYQGPQINRNTARLAGWRRSKPRHLATYRSFARRPMRPGQDLCVAALRRSRGAGAIQRLLPATDHRRSNDVSGSQSNDIGWDVFAKDHEGAARVLVGGVTQCRPFWRVALWGTSDPLRTSRQLMLASPLQVLAPSTQGHGTSSLPLLTLAVSMVSGPA